MFSCPETANDRAKVEAQLGGIKLEVGNLVLIMLTTERAWEAVHSFITKIMNKKEEAEAKAKDRNEDLKSDNRSKPVNPAEAGAKMRKKKGSSPKAISTPCRGYAKAERAWCLAREEGS